ncbi:MAG: hypothetical protein ACLTDX_01830 [[Clostridium] innocuum]
MTAVRSDGLGDLFLQLEEVKKKLAAQGLFDPQKKKPLAIVSDAHRCDYRENRSGCTGYPDDDFPALAAG